MLLLSPPSRAQVEAVPVQPVPVVTQAVPVQPVPVVTQAVPVQPMPRPWHPMRRTVVVLPMRAEDLGDRMRKEFQHTVREVTENTLAGRGFYVLRGEEVRGRLAGFDPFNVCHEGCNMGAVNALGANFLVSGGVRQGDNGFEGMLRLFNGATGVPISSIRVQGETMRELRGQVEANAGVLFAPLMAPPPLRRIWATGARASSQYGSPNWSAMQATGAPNTFRCASIVTAWASRLPDAPGEWIELYYPGFYMASGVDIVESFNPGAVVGVDVRVPSGQWITVRSGPDQTRTCPGTYRVMFSNGPMQVNAVRLRLASEAVPGWNEIDAAALLVQ